MSASSISNLRGRVHCVRCDVCNHLVRHQVSKSASNPNRGFYRCENPDCKHFQWLDSGLGGEYDSNQIMAISTRLMELEARVLKLEKKMQNLATMTKCLFVLVLVNLALVMALKMKQ